MRERERKRKRKLELAATAAGFSKAGTTPADPNLISAAFHPSRLHSRRQCAISKLLFCAGVVLCGQSLPRLAVSTVPPRPPAHPVHAHSVLFSHCARACCALSSLSVINIEKAMRHNFVNQKGSAGGCASAPFLCTDAAASILCARAARYVLCA